jgi:hypothetical protein
MLFLAGYPGPFRLGDSPTFPERETGMTLGAMAVGGLAVAAVLIVVAITLINKFAE